MRWNSVFGLVCFTDSVPDASSDEVVVDMLLATATGSKRPCTTVSHDHFSAVRNRNGSLNSVYYPHMPIGKVWIYRLLFVVCLFVCVCVWLRISLPRIELAASNFAWWFFDVLGRE